MIRLNATAGIPAHYMNRHALVTGPTGTGKTVSIMRLIESLSQAGTPTICPDVKGDLPPLAASCPARVIAPAQGLCVPIWAMGADLLARALELTDAQAGALEIAFAYAEEIAAPLDTLGDLRALLTRLAAAPDMVAHIGYLTRASIGAIQRALLRIEKSGQAGIFGAPAFDIANAMDSGLVSIIDASALYHSPRLYGAFMLWLLRELAMRFPECGDLDKPRLALVIDESHCLFHEASPALLRSIEATARLIRSKGVALVFASQSPDDLPAVIRAQCATRIEHARAHGVGNCLFSTLDSSGNATAPRMIRPALPDCMSKPGHEQATKPAPVMQASHDPAPQAADSMLGAYITGFTSLFVINSIAFALGYWFGSG